MGDGQGPTAAHSALRPRPPLAGHSAGTWPRHRMLGARRPVCPASGEAGRLTKVWSWRCSLVPTLPMGWTNQRSCWLSMSWFLLYSN